MRRRLTGPTRLLLLLGLVARLAVACGDDGTSATIESLDRADDAVTYIGPAKSQLELGILGIADDRSAHLVGFRIDALPAGVTWDEHLAWATAHLDGRKTTASLENVAPCVAEFRGDDDSVLLLALIEADQLVVMTALITP